MKPMKDMMEFSHENVLFCYDEESGLKSIIAIHDTTLGPAIGGTRFYNYETEEDALYDVLRLSRGMTFKNAAGGLHAGGGKAVIIGDPTKIKTPELLKAYGRMVNRLNGAYYTAEDMNINEQDVEYIASETEYCVGKKAISGNPSPYTSLGVYQGIKAAAKEVFGTDDLKGRTINVVGLGAVGYPCAEMLHKEGAILTVADVKEEAVERAVKELGATAVSVNEIQFMECDIFTPCAMGAIISKDNVKDMKCKIIAGSANNVLVNNEAGDALDAAGILYIPDYIINAGGVISAGYEIEPGGWHKEKTLELVNGIYNTVEMVIATAKEKKIPTYKAADEYAMSIINAAKK